MEVKRTSLLYTRAPGHYQKNSRRKRQMPQALWNKAFISGRKRHRSRMWLITSTMKRPERCTRRNLCRQVRRPKFPIFRKRRASTKGRERNPCSSFDASRVEDYCVDEKHRTKAYQGYVSSHGCMCWVLLCHGRLHASPQTWKVYRMGSGTKVCD